MCPKRASLLRMTYTDEFAPHVWGSPVGAVDLALRAVNEVKLDRARLSTWMGDTLTDCFQLDSGCGLTSCVPSLRMLCKYCWFSTACPINRLWGSKGRSSDSAPEHYKIVSDQDAVLPLVRVKGYVWHWYNTIFKTIAGAAVLKLLNLFLWANTCNSRLTCITRCLYRASRVAKL